ncbi:Prp24p [Sugiyamaella lignohabitans]|uniref:U4/U6 snRNA-associated-splicing factor PRP24 n=1 Tax=Sugiyamaella lignohabitans TaxID=796027 RepID=A0A167CI78_9ASCO|nr:Prp24p [Sugiyamaella lignohabitans]ANB11734.1 Prp24p [Sugiyamaella lignohabitans]
MDVTVDSTEAQDGGVQELQDLYLALESDLYLPETHIKLINKLRELSMVDELEAARSVMESILAPSQQIWLDWIEDYQTWGKSVEEISNLFSTALKTCPTVDIVEVYGRFILQLIENGVIKDAYTGIDDSESPLNQHLMNLAGGLDETQNNIAQSHKAWNAYRDIFVFLLAQEKASQSGTTLKILPRLKELYLARLRIPHAEIATTFSDFSTFVTTYYNSTYEGEMVAANKIYSETLKILNYRDSWELKLKSDPSLQTFADYIQWELERPKRYFRADLVQGLYERVIELYQYVALVWDDYIIFLCEQPKSFSRKTVESAIQRATKSCPTSGSLWAHRIRVSESYGADFEDIIGLKMTIDDISAFAAENEDYDNWKPLALAWLAYLFRANTSSDNLFIDQLRDDCNFSLEKSYSFGKQDPNFEVESLVIGIFTRLGESDNVRNIWKRVSKYQGTKAIFWLKWFEWEKSQSGNSYTNALDVLKIPLSRNNIDWPEMIIQAYTEFERLNGSAYSTQQSVITSRRKLYEIAKKRSKESYDQQLYQDSETGTKENAELNIEGPSANAENASETPSSKKRSHEQVESSNVSDAPTKQPKTTDHRDREHNTVIVYDLPSETTEKDLEGFFNECGNIVSVIQHTEANSAVVEFSNQDDTKAALTRDHKSIKDKEVRVTSGYQTTLFVTNFPASATKESLTELFKKYGQVISVRFPSLKYNTNRRFCYVQYLSSESAKSAVGELDGSGIFDEEEKLVVKISDPSNKQTRSGGNAEGRELYIKSVDFSLNEDFVRSTFAKYGTVEKLRLPPSKRPGRLHDGYGFVTMSTVDEANTAIEALDGSILGDTGRVVSVSIAGKAPSKKSTKVVKINHNDQSRKLTASEIESKTIYISNLSDTVNDAQLRSILEKYGPLHKIVLKPDLEGAIVEYETVADAGKASLSLDGQKIADKPIRLGSSIVKPAPNPKKSTMFMPPSARGKKR